MFDLLQHNSSFAAIILMVAAVGVVLFVWLRADRQPSPARTRVHVTPRPTDTN